MRGVRVGEESHPGAVAETLIDSLEFDLTTVDADVGTATALGRF